MNPSSLGKENMQFYFSQGFYFIGAGSFAIVKNAYYPSHGSEILK